MSAPTNCDGIKFVAIVMISSVGRGAELAVAVVLGVAGLAKLLDLDGTRLALGRLLAGRRPPPRWLSTAVAVALATAELLLGTLLIYVPGRAAVVCSTLMTACFVWAVTRAQRRGIACGCFGSLFSGTSGPLELRRALAMCFLASTATATRLWSPDSHVSMGASVAVSAVWISVLLAISRHKSNRPVETIRLALSGRAPDRGGWRRATPWARAAIIRRVRADEVTAEVVTHPQVGKPHWRWARVRTRHIGAKTVVSIVARTPGGILQALWSVDAPIAVVGYTRRGVVLPT